MKKICFFFVFILALCLGDIIGYAQNNGNQTPVVIVVTNDGSFGNVPKAPVSIPISGFVNDNSIYLFFSNNIGEINVCLKDSSGSTLISTLLDTSDGSESLPFTGVPDSYTIIFTLEDNTTYVGRFEILS